MKCKVLKLAKLAMVAIVLNLIFAGNSFANNVLTDSLPAGGILPDAQGSNKQLLKFDFSSCASCTDGSNADWSELSPQVLSAHDAASLQVSSIRSTKSNALHACSPGAEGNALGIAEGTAIEFDLTIGPNAIQYLAGISFLETASNYYHYESKACGSSRGANNPPAYVDVAVFKNGTQVYEKTIQTKHKWNSRDIALTGLDAFVLDKIETFTFRFTPYGASTNRGGVRIWNIDELLVYGSETTSTDAGISFTSPHTIAFLAPQGVTETEVNFDLPNAVTTCTKGGLSITQTKGPKPGSIAPVGVSTLVFEAVDACNNSQTFFATLSVVSGSTSLIEFESPNDQILTLEQGETSIQINFNAPVATTSCAKGGLVVSQISGPKNDELLTPGNYEVVFLATDACGNSEKIMMYISVTSDVYTWIDLLPGRDVTVVAELGRDGAFVMYDIPPAITNCPQGGLAVEPFNSLASGAYFPIGRTTVVFKATDACGDEQLGSLVVEVIDNQPSVTDCTGIGQVYECDGNDVGGWKTSSEWIERVVFANLDNKSYQESYELFDNYGGAEVIIGIPEILTISPGLKNSGYSPDLYYTAFIDFNQDGDFDDPGEEVLRDNAKGTGISAVVDIPQNATTGITRLRVILRRNAYAEACESFSFGETEDYLVCISSKEQPVNTLSVAPPESEFIILEKGEFDTEFDADIHLQVTTTCQEGNVNIAKIAGPDSGEKLTPGIYTLNYKVSDACGNETVVNKTITVATAQDASANSRISAGGNIGNLQHSVFPNPASAEVNISLEELLDQPVDILVLNRIGQQVMAYHVDRATEQPVVFDTSTLSQGLHIVRIISGEISKSISLMILHE